MQESSLFRAAYASPLCPIILLSNGRALTGLYFEGQKHFPVSLLQNAQEATSLPALQEAVRWLDLYFDGKHVSPSDILLAPSGSAFQLLIWRMLCSIPYGETVTYGQLAREAAAMLGKTTIAAQAVGGAVGKNPISLIIPCHRVLGSGGNLTGYAGGTEKKRICSLWKRKTHLTFPQIGYKIQLQSNTGCWVCPAENQAINACKPDEPDG